MRKVLGAVLGAVLLLVAAWAVTRWLAMRRVNAALIEEVTAAWNAREPRSGTANENGFACAAALLDDKVDLRAITPAMVEKIEKAPPAEGLPIEITRAQSWAERFRACGDAKEVSIVPEIVPITAWPAAQKGSFALYSLEKITRAELRLAFTTNDSEKAARLCLGTLEVEVDRSFLGFREALGVGLALEKLAPPCARALHGLSPDTRTALAPRFAALRSRMISTSRAYERDWLFRSVRSRFSTMSDEQRARVPPELVPQSVDSFLGSMVLAGSWTTQDAAVRKFIAVADTPGPARNAAASAVEEADRYGLPLLRYHGELTLSEECEALDSTRVILGVLGKLAAGEDPGTSPGLTRSAVGLVILGPRSKNIVLPLQ